MKKKRRTYLLRIVDGGKVMMPSDLRRLHKHMAEIEGISVISDEMRAVVEEEWPELAPQTTANEASPLKAMQQESARS
jgi:hypothetical protein